MNILFSHYAIIYKEGFGRSFMLAKNLARLGNSVTFLTCQPSNQFKFPYYTVKEENVLIIAFPDFVPNFFRRTGFGILSTVLKCFYILSKNYDIVHSDNGHRPSSGIPCVLHSLFRKSKHIMEWWDYFGRGGQYDEKRFIKKITHGVYDLITEVPSKKLVDGVVSLSEFTKKRAIANSIDKNKVIVVNGGCDIDEINYIPDNYDNKIKYGINPNLLTFLFIGMNNSECYDLVPFIEAVNELKKKKIKVNWITTGSILSDEIKEKYSIGDELIEFGWLDYKEFSDRISCADIFLLVQKNSLVNEARWPNKIGDYFSAGRLIMTNTVGELNQLTEKYPDSFIIVNNNKENIIKNILTINNKKHDILNIGGINRKIAERDLSWYQQSKKLFNFYQNIINQEKL